MALFIELKSIRPNEIRRDGRFPHKLREAQRLFMANAARSGERHAVFYHHPTIPLLIFANRPATFWLQIPVTLSVDQADWHGDLDDMLDGLITTSLY